MAQDGKKALAPASASPWPIALAGLVSLAVAMGLGRFAFTPLLPMMLNDGVLDLPAASWLASANYFGYLLGAMLCTLQPWLWARFRWLPWLAELQPELASVPAGLTYQPGSEPSAGNSSRTFRIVNMPPMVM